MSLSVGYLENLSKKSGIGVMIKRKDKGVGLCPSALKSYGTQPYHICDYFENHKS